MTKADAPAFPARGRRFAMGLALALWTLGHAALGVSVVLGLRHPDSLVRQGAEGIPLLGAFVVLGAVGFLLSSRRGENPVGWLLLGVYTALGLLSATTEYATFAFAGAANLPGGVASAWLSNWLWYPLLTTLFVFVPLLFPTGRPPTRRWRIVGLTGGLGIALITFNAMFVETLTVDGVDGAIANPIGIAGVVAEQGPVEAVALPLLATGFLGAIASVVVRFRRSRGIERQQLKWMLFAAALVGVNLLTDPLEGVLPEALGLVVFPASVTAFPLAIGIAIMRYRLYDIDRVISRTLSYAVLTGALVAVYAGGVVLLGRAMQPFTAGSEVAVAASTLLAVALFQPLRTRVQRVVDRRFNRARYDAERTVEAFAVRLRHTVTFDDLDTELTRVVQRTLAPTHTSVWLAGGATGGRVSLELEDRLDLDGAPERQR